MLKAPAAELCQNACGRVNKQKIFHSRQCSPECSTNKFRAYIYIYIYIEIYIYIYKDIYIYIYACCMLFNAVGRPDNRAPPFPPGYNN